MHLVWGCLRRALRILPERARRIALTLAGPIALAGVLFVWLVLLLVGAALVVWPELGRDIQKSQGSTPTDFWSALYYSGYTLSTLGYGDIVPQTDAYRVFTVVLALLGFSVLTMSLSYVTSVYSALVRRNTLAQALHHRSGRTDSPAILLQRLLATG